MKLVYSIVSDDDSDNVTRALNEAGFKVTKLASTGGFFKKGNATLMIGTDEERVSKAIKIVEEVCGTRKTVDVKLPCAGASYNIPLCCYSVPQKMEVGGATIFVMDVARYERI